MRPRRSVVFMRMAHEVKTLSTCQRKQVGVIITDWDRSQVVSMGYNGNYRGGPNKCDDPTFAGSCGCLHAEDNALIKAPYNQVDLVLYTTLSPCKTCAKRIINSSVKKVVYHERYRNTDGIRLLNSAGIITFNLETA